MQWLAQVGRPGGCGSLHAKISKQRPHLNCRQESSPAHHSSSSTPNRKRNAFHLQQEDAFYSTAPAGRGIFSLPGNHSANEK